MTTYKHKHHIIPRHMGGSDDPSNLVELTIEEHAEAHRKLYEEHGRWQDKKAWLFLSGQATTDKQVSRKDCKASEESRRKMSEAAKKRSSNRLGKTFTKEQRENISKGRKGKCVGAENPFYGKTHSEEVKQVIREAASKQKRSERGSYI